MKTAWRVFCALPTEYGWFEQHVSCGWQVRELRNPGVVYSSLMDFMAHLARLGLIHCDFNEFNVLVRIALLPHVWHPLPNVAGAYAQYELMKAWWRMPV